MPTKRCTCSATNDALVNVRTLWSAPLQKNKDILNVSKAILDFKFTLRAVFFVGSSRVLTDSGCFEQPPVQLDPECGGVGPKSFLLTSAQAKNDMYMSLYIADIAALCSNAWMIRSALSRPVIWLLTRPHSSNGGTPSEDGCNLARRSFSSLPHLPLRTETRLH